MRARGLSFAALVAALALCVAPAAHAQTMTQFHGTTIGAFQAPLTTWRDRPFRTIVRQRYDFSCGSAALATVLRHHHGLEVSEADAFAAMWRTGDQARIRTLGFSMLDMKRYAESLGFKADGFRVGLDELARYQRPAIALIDVNGYKHFVVIKGVAQRDVLIGDSNRGLRVESREVFERQWNGILFILHAGPNRAIFNAASEWAQLRRHQPELRTATIGEVLRELTPPYQITPVRIIGPGGV